MPAVFSATITLVTQDVPWVPVNPTVSFGAITVSIGAPISMSWTVNQPTIVQPGAQTVSITAPVSMLWTVLQPSVYGLQYVPPFTGEVRESGVEVGDLQESPGP